MKNLLTLHEAIVVALINLENRQGLFEDIADYIERRNLFPERAGYISLAKQIMLRSTKSKGRYSHLFEQLTENTIRLRNLHNTKHQA